MGNSRMFRLHELEVERWMRSVDEKLGRILAALTQERDGLMSQLDDLLQEVGEQTTEVAGIKTLIDGLHSQLSDALANGDTAKAQQILDAVKANDAALVAILSGTPSADQIPESTGVGPNAPPPATDSTDTTDTPPGA